MKRRNCHRCPKCGKRNSYVVHSMMSAGLKNEEIIRRTCKCRACGLPFTVELTVTNYYWIKR